MAQWRDSTSLQPTGERDRLQKEVLAGLDDLQRKISEERKRRVLEGGNIKSSNASDPERDEVARLKAEPDRDEVARLKAEMAELQKRFARVCDRLEPGTTGSKDPEVKSPVEVKPSLPPGPPPIRPRSSLPPDLLVERIRLQHKANRRSRLTKVLLVLAIVLAGALLGWSKFSFLYQRSGEVAVATVPSQADVYIDDQFQGQTPTLLKSIRAGSHSVRFSKEGFEPVTREIRVDGGETTHVDARLNEMSASQLQVLARSLYDQGKLREADRICTLLFQKPPYDAFALDLKQKILTGLLSKIGGGEERTASPPLEKYVAGSSRSAETESSDKPQQSSSPGGRLTGSSKPAQPPKSLPIRAPVDSKPSIQYPAPKAVTIKPAESLARGEPNPSIQTDRIDADVIAQIRNRIQSRNLAEARALLQQLPGTSSPAMELKTLLQLAETEVQKQQNQVSSTLQKAESALIVGHYISPPDDNVVLHCNRGLSLDPQNKRLLALKKDVINRSIDQARDWIRRGQFEQARASFSTLNRLAQSDVAFPVRRDWFQDELKNLEFTSYSVIHEHKLGSCHGRLRMNGHVLSFVPSDDSVDGFTEPLSRVVVTQGGQTLKIRLPGKTYQFQPNSGSNRDSFQGAYEQLMNLVAKATHSGGSAQ